MKKVLIQNNEQLELVREEIRVSSLFSHPNLLPLLDHAIISVKVSSFLANTYSSLCYITDQIFFSGKRSLLTKSVTGSARTHAVSVRIFTKKIVPGLNCVICRIVSYLKIAMLAYTWRFLNLILKT